MQELVCGQCSKRWTRPPKRGRKPSLCPTCQQGGSVAPAPPDVAPDPTPATKAKRKRKSKWAKLKDEQTKGKTATDLDDLPLAGRTSGWCTDYDPAPEAQHDKCDGDLGKYRCPCDCHEWS